MTYQDPYQQSWPGQSYPPQGVSMPAATPPPVRRGKGQLIAALVVALLIGAGIGFAIGHFTASKSGSTKKSPTQAATKLHVRGTFTLTDFTGFNHPLDTGATCHGTNGYGDISTGAEVVISSDAGKTLSITRLGQGFVTGAGCQFKFNATIPAGLKFYSVEIGHRGAVKETEQQMRHPQLTLGN